MKRFLVRCFTLIELLVVLAVLSIVLLIAMPRFVSSVNPQKTKQFMFGLYSSLNYLSEKTILEKKVILFNFDLDERRYYFTASQEGNIEGEVKDRYLVPSSFPPHFEVESVRLVPGDVIHDGSIAVPFTPNGILYSFEIRVNEGDNRYIILTGNALNNRMQLLREHNDQLEKMR